MKKIFSLIGAIAIAACTFGSPALAQENSGTITIPISEYEKLRKATEVKEDKQYWNMTYQQILDDKNGNEEKAWELYEYWVLRRLSVFGTVGGNMEDLATDISILNEIDNEKPITLVISSPGGYVYNGLIFYNAMLASDAPVHTVCDGLAASMAAVLLVAGDHRVATPACHWMVHELGASGNFGGQTTDWLKQGERMVDLENILLDVVAENTGLSVPDVRKLAEFETFYDSEEILRLGVVDEVIDNRPRSLNGTRELSEDLLPLNRMRKNLTEKLTRE